MLDLDGNDIADDDLGLWAESFVCIEDPVVESLSILNRKLL